MTLDSRFNRRSLLKSAIVTGAGGLSRPLSAESAAEATVPKQIVDTHVYLGQWPHAYLADSEPTALIALLRRHQITQAWAGRFDGLFHKDVAGVNERLAVECASASDKFLVPFGTINPTLPDWEDDVRRCHELHHMRGIRLHPSYHGYTLEDSRFTQLLQLAAEQRLMVQLVVRLHTSQHRWLTPKVASVNLVSLPNVLKRIPTVPMVIAGVAANTNDEVIQSLMRVDGVYFDLSGETGHARSTAVDTKGSASTRFVFGSQMPLGDIREAIERYRQAGVEPTSVADLRWND
jgi:predicted TIM-barrel fold metal-dependent hydrolase